MTVDDLKLKLARMTDQSPASFNLISNKEKLDGNELLRKYCKSHYCVVSILSG